jgi:RND family efflux transporter MFP subunit
LLACAAGAVGCNPAPPPLAPQKPPEVTVGVAVLRDVTDFEEFQGKTEAEKAVEVRAHVTGFLASFRFKDGAEVKKDKVIFEIDPPLFEAELDRAEGSLAQAEARVARLTYDFSRAERLVAQKSITQEEYDRIAGDLSEAKAAVKTALATRKMAKVNFEYCKVTAPISGRISRRFVDPGNIVKADETILTRIVSLDPLYVYFDVDERTYLRILHHLRQRGISASEQKDMTVSMGLANEKGFPRPGTVDFIDNRVDPDSGSVWLRGIFPNPGEVLTPGLFVRIRLPVGASHPAVLIPEQALGTDQGQKFVYVLSDENEAVYRPIQVGAQHGDMRVVEKGVSPGERIIVTGLQRVRPGAKVEPKEPEVQTNKLEVKGE